MLAPYRVIDCTDESGLMCGQLLADLGADVLQIEPADGSPARRLGPWFDAPGDPEGSLYWWAYARNKRSIALDLESESDRGELRRLVAGADFFIESARPGRMAELGLGYDDLAALQPGLVYVSITPFGQTGPKSQWVGTDLTHGAAGGAVFLSGEQDMPPVRVCVPQAHAHASTDAAVGALIAHFGRKRSGVGQHVDVSAQQSVTLATMFRALDAPLEEASARRVSGGGWVGGVFLKNRFELADGGWVTLGPAILPSTGHFMRRLLDWVADEGVDVGDLRAIDWGSYARNLMGGAVEKSSYEPFEAIMTAFFLTRTKADVMAQAVERRLLLAPVLDLDEIIDSEQLAVREFCVEVEAREGQKPLRVPGPFARFSDSPISYRLPPPRLDEHGSELRSEPDRQPAASARAAGEAQLPLAGVKVLDLFWILAGPGSTRMLADYGATVVHVESMRHLDTLRVIPPYQFNMPHVEGSGAFQSANANKLGITLDLARHEARDAVLELAAWADVVTESFAPGVIDHYGLGYDKLREVNPELIMISSCLMGQTGPWRNFTGFGNLAANVTGFQPLAGWPERPPAGPYGAYTDFLAVRFNALAILGALEHRERTGRGQYIDQSQAEAALHFLAPAFLDYTANGVVPQPIGNEDAECHPHGVFECAGEDRWVAIAVRHEHDWRELCAAMDREDLRARRGERAEATGAIAAWTASRDAGAIAELLQGRGVPAHETLDTPGLFACPQLQHRGHYVETQHEIYQTTTVESSRLRLSRSPARVPASALSFGRDNRAVLEGILGYGPERIAELAARGILL